jgi:hypothetical protein
MKAWVVVVVLVGFVMPAHAERSRKSRNVALALSVGVTASGVTAWIVDAALVDNRSIDANGHIEYVLSPAQSTVLVVAGATLFVLGPTTGHIYAGQAWNAGLKYRLIGGGILAVTGLPALAMTLEDDPHQPAFGLLTAGAFAGGALYAYAMFREIGTAPCAVDAHNRRLTVVPVAGNSPGLSVVGTF